MYGKLPRDLGLIDISPNEMMFWMYLPISLPGSMSWRVPSNLEQFDDILCAVHAVDPCLWRDRYVYLTAKTMYVGSDKNMNRPGWHSDGFGTYDLNYIWSDRAPTQFVEGFFQLSADCATSMEQMEAIGRMGEEMGDIITYPDKHLLELNEEVIHRAAPKVSAGMRTFVKVSLSEDRYDLIGNSINHLIPDSHWPLVPRRTERNHPQSTMN
jgi:hypothetical protein